MRMGISTCSSSWFLWKLYSYLVNCHPQLRRWKIFEKFFSHFYHHLSKLFSKKLRLNNGYIRTSQLANQHAFLLYHLNGARQTRKEGKGMYSLPEVQIPRQIRSVKLGTSCHEWSFTKKFENIEEVNDRSEITINFRNFSLIRVNQCQNKQFAFSKFPEYFGCTHQLRSSIPTTVAKDTCSATKSSTDTREHV